MPLVIAIKPGYHGLQYRNIGDEFFVGDAELKGVPLKDKDGKATGEFRAPSWFKAATPKAKAEAAKAKSEVDKPSEVPGQGPKKGSRVETAEGQGPTQAQLEAAAAADAEDVL
jgi:hypothetical protein